MQYPLVSIQIPTYNQKEFIKDALDSALAQNYEHLQIVVCDDCSPDYDIFEYLKDYVGHPKIEIHRNEKNLGRVGNYHHCLYDLVKGDWFVNLDGDDYFTNRNFVKTAIQSILSTKERVSVFQGGAFVHRIKDNNIPNQLINGSIYLINGIDYIKHFHHNLGFTHASIFYNVKDAKSKDFYNINALDIDYYSYLKILPVSSILFWGEKVYHWRQHDEQETHTLNFDACVVKYDELQDIENHYKLLPISIKAKMLKQTRVDITIQLYRTFFNEKFSFNRLLFVLRKTKANKNYIIPLLSLIKRKLI
ncbi:glycosyltransferase family 2 protein [Soonwooa buanensis]|nr:glycosyltransferase family 2 protein [Soonwooa buanensis]